MKKFFQALGMICLICFSFVFTEKTAQFVKDNDNLMITIKEKSDSYKVESVNATIEEDTIIPGLCGKEINKSKTYNNMKRVGDFNPNLIIYDLILPDVTITKKYDKYIVGGNPNKNMVSIILKIKNNVDVDSILKVIGNTKVNFFIDGNWLEQNEINIKKINSYNLGNMSYGGDYTKSGYAWISAIINKYGNQENEYCYFEEKNDEYLKLCEGNHNYSIFPSIIVKSSPLSEVKMKLTAGSIISLDVNNTVLTELPLLINYIKNKGYNIVSLDEHLSEDI